MMTKTEQDAAPSTLQYITRPLAEAFIQIEVHFNHSLTAYFGPYYNI